MKELVIIECKTCFAKYNGEDELVRIEPFEEVDLILRRIAKCSACKQAADRTIAGKKKKLGP